MSSSSSAFVPLETHKALLSSILSYLSSLKQLPLSSSLLPNPDSFDAALDCLTEATGLPLTSPSTSPPLPTVFAAGQRALFSTSPPYPSDSDPAFQQFLTLLTDKGFFTGTQPGTAAHSERLQSAKDKYAQKYPQQQGGAEGAVAGPKVVSEADKAAAEKLKGEGNSFLSAGKHGAALDKYTAAIAHNPSSAILYANRAAAHINLGQYSKAEADCRSSISIDATYGKAHYRLGQALLQQKRPEEAIAAFDTALQHIEPSMRDAINEQLDAARAAANKAHTPQTTDGGNDDDDDSGPGAGGMPDFSSLLTNPMFAQIASQLGGAGGAGGMDFDALLNNPQLMQMASSMFGGGSGGGGGSASSAPARSAASSAASAPGGSAIADFLSSPEGQQLASDPDLAPVLEDVRKNGQSAMMKHMNNPAVMAKLTKIAGPMLAKMSAKQP